MLVLSLVSSFYVVQDSSPEWAGCSILFNLAIPHKHAWGLISCVFVDLSLTVEMGVVVYWYISVYIRPWFNLQHYN